MSLVGRSCADVRTVSGRVAVGTLAVLRWLEGGRRSNYIRGQDSRLKIHTAVTLKREEANNANNCSPFLYVRVSRVKLDSICNSVQ